MTQIHQKFYRENLDFLIKNLKIDELLAPLLAVALISDRDYQNLQRLLTNDGAIVAAEHLVTNVLFKRPEIQSMYDFVDVLHQNNHTHLVSYFLKDFPTLQDKYSDLSTEDNQQPSTSTPSTQQGSTSTGHNHNTAGEKNPPSVLSDDNVASAGSQTPAADDSRGVVQIEAADDSCGVVQIEAADHSLGVVQTEAADDPPGVAQTAEIGDADRKINSNITAVDRLKKESAPSTRGRGYDHGHGNGKFDDWNKKTTDIPDIKTDKLKNYICQINYKEGSATGFVYDYHESTPHCYIMTSQHIQQKLENNMNNAYVIFNKQTEGPPPAECKIKQICTFPRSETLDFVILELEENNELYQYFKGKNTMKSYIKDEDMKNVKYMRLLGHPLGSSLQMDVIEVEDCADVTNKIIQKQGGHSLHCSKGHYLEHLTKTDKDSYVFYSSSALHGSSGAPCFQYGPEKEDIKLICIQKGGLYARTTNPKDGEQCDFAMGVKLFHIKQHIDEYIKQQTEQPMDTGECCILGTLV